MNKARWEISNCRRYFLFNRCICNGCNVKEVSKKRLKSLQRPLLKTSSTNGAETSSGRDPEIEERRDFWRRGLASTYRPYSSSQDWNSLMKTIMPPGIRLIPGNDKIWLYEGKMCLPWAGERSGRTDVITLVLHWAERFARWPLDTWQFHPFHSLLCHILHYTFKSQIRDNNLPSDTEIEFCSIFKLSGF